MYIKQLTLQESHSEKGERAHYEVMLIQILCPGENRPEGVKNLTSGGLNARLSARHHRD